MRVIGLMSGTSVDGIDAVVVDLHGAAQDLTIKVQASATYGYSESLREKILGVCAGDALSIADLASLDDQIAQAFAQAARQIQSQLGDQQPIDLISSHGQTVFHRPPGPNPDFQLGYSVQLGRGEVIAQLTQIPTVTNFRAADIALGGQGAPLVPRIDLCLLGHPEKTRCVQNIGGIGNVTYLPAQGDTDGFGTGVFGWDTGPGNVLIDLAVHYFSQGQQTYDHNGAWAATGTPDLNLIQAWLKHPYFQAPPPKSTGRELFGLAYFQDCLKDAAHLTPADTIATLTEFTAATIAHSYQSFLPQMPDQVFLCGGGALNSYLRSRLGAWLQPIPVLTTTELGVPVESKEAIAFAVLAYWKGQNLPGNLPSVTGASRETPLGTLHCP
ncbi:anhydro-N-acetylmuramic acid kinase [Synechococcus sp. PCC 6312]|uniref:anhydro-N-acetylmuramic acid kinase n=1 Tax=Synechococcus sp. (strain ATCC 27167 / PCC 6312) TaxID=195253 RepID=UPI00029EC7DB|nr:anhydro-N-acetylmuramic acid kinase [Synechococcus sp. PCC 6312]AFY61447.1 molecular chaperone [Synechococcus sp. PCC 6312]